MKILFLGDLVGNDGMYAVQHYLNAIIQKYEINYIIANGENITNGAGISAGDYRDLKKMGIHVITTGNHYKKNATIQEIMKKNKYCIRPCNYDDDYGTGVVEYEVENGQVLVVINIILRQHMNDIVQCPFTKMHSLLTKYNIKNSNIAGVIVDAHGTCSFEKKSLAYFLDGKITALIGTHTHVQTNDLSILPKGSLYLSDAGMCGAYTHCSGTNPQSAIKTFIPDEFSTDQIVYDTKIGLNGVCFSIANKFITECNLISNWSA